MGFYLNQAVVYHDNGANATMPTPRKLSAKERADRVSMKELAEFLIENGVV